MIITQSIVIRKADTDKHGKKEGSQTIDLDNIADYANPALEYNIMLCALQSVRIEYRRFGVCPA